MEEFVQVVFSPTEFLGGVDLDNESENKLYGRNHEEEAKGPL